MYIIFVSYLMLFTLFISVVEMNPFGSNIKNSYHDNGQYQSLLENNDSPELTRGKQLSDNCTDDTECSSRVNNSECRNAICQCMDGFRDDTNRYNKTLKACLSVDSNVDDKLNEETDSPTSPPEKMNGSHMLPIMIVLGIMFVGMCVALNLFSRAQFRNNRSLFTTNSHIVKTSSRSSSHRRTSSSHPTVSAAATSQHRANSSGSGSLTSDSPSHPLKISTHTTVCDSPIKIDRQQRTNRVLDNCISTTTRTNINSMTTNVINGESVADVTSGEAPIASSSQV